MDWNFFSEVKETRARCRARPHPRELHLGFDPYDEDSRYLRGTNLLWVIFHKLSDDQKISAIDLVNQILRIKSPNVRSLTAIHFQQPAE